MSLDWRVHVDADRLTLDGDDAQPFELWNDSYPSIVDVNLSFARSQMGEVKVPPARNV